MDLSYGAAATQFRGEVAMFLEEAWQPGTLGGAPLRAFTENFRREATARGTLYRSIPTALGGGSEQPVDVIRAQVIREAFTRAKAPMEVGGNGINMLVPTLLEPSSPMAGPYLAMWALCPARRPRSFSWSAWLAAD